MFASTGSGTGVRRVTVALATVTALAICGCPGGGSGGGSGGGGALGEQPDVVGDMSDTSYWNLRDKPPRVSASGERVAMQKYAGSFIWAEYAAPWCGPCKQQASIVHGLEGALGSDLVFLTIMTSEMGGYGHPATQATARRWASQYGLEPDRVLAADLTAITVPRHILYSPDGHTLLVHTGLLQGGRIRELATARMNDWKAWKQSGTRASWMR